MDETSPQSVLAVRLKHATNLQWGSLLSCANMLSFSGLGPNSHEVLWLCFKKKDESEKTIVGITFCLEKQIASFPTI